MKERITLIGLCIMVITVIALIGKQITAQTTTTTFENIIIKGKLIVGTGDNKILLENNDKNSSIIIDTKGSSISISATKEEAIILITSDNNMDAKRNLPNGITLFTSKDKTNEHNSLILLKDSENTKTIRTNK